MFWFSLGYYIWPLCLFFFYYFRIKYLKSSNWLCFFSAILLVLVTHGTCRKLKAFCKRSNLWTPVKRKTYVHSCHGASTLFSKQSFSWLWFERTHYNLLDYNLCVYYSVIWGTLIWFWTPATVNEVAVCIARLHLSFPAIACVQQVPFKQSKEGISVVQQWECVHAYARKARFIAPMGCLRLTPVTVIAPTARVTPYAWRGAPTCRTCVYETMELVSGHSSSVGSRCVVYMGTHLPWDRFSG